ncbi:response regulator [Oxalobacteraceae bacterium R-40]|uniref:Response regulator n=1 Tax=Keguizhuia sedimenti TaxID=3064264 RepID=A0ABU1BU24_9BURK|nr:response regulator [Oxalobacteraceae bacterium R-40]
MIVALYRMPHILLVDEKTSLLSLLRQDLERNGYQVTVAFDPLAALDAIRKKSIDAVVADLCMPGMNGEELLPQLRHYRPALLGILVSGYTRNFTWDMDSQTRLLSKPIGGHELVRSIEDMLDIRLAA